MSKHECQRCGEAKAAGDMVTRNGKPSRTCVECFRASFKGGKAKTASAPKARKAAAEAPEPVTIAGPRLEVLPGFGFRSSVESEMLVIEQDAGEGDDRRTDSISLSRTEARVLFAQFHDWVHA